MTLKIRPFEPTKTEYQTIVTVLKTIEPEYSRTAEELQYADETLGEGTICQRFIGELNSETVAISILV